MQPPAAWYPDPNGTGDWRWWDGQSWTHHVEAPAFAPVAPEPALPRAWRLAGLVALFVLVVAVTAATLTLVAGNDSPSDGGWEQTEQPAPPAAQPPQGVAPQPVEQPPPGVAPLPAAQPARPAGDERAKLQARTAQTAIETWTIDHDGSYVGVTVADLIAIEPALADSAMTLPEAPMPETYVISVESETTRNLFSIRRLASGAIEQTCEKRGDGGCPQTGRW